MNHWVVRNIDTKEAIGITNEDPDLGPIETSNGVWTHVVESYRDGYVIKRRMSILEYVPEMILERISESEYETYQEMGLF